jgi:preprotein translocase SecE subunit
VAEPAKPKRRIVKKVETVREKTAKSAEVKPKKQRGIIALALSYVTAPFKWIGRQLAKLERFKAFRVLGLFLWPPYFRNSWKELRQVTWPGRRETWHLTGAVIIFAVIFGALVAGVDFGLDKIFRKIIIE